MGKKSVAGFVFDVFAQEVPFGVDIGEVGEDDVGTFDVDAGEEASFDEFDFWEL